ncbi:MAG: hypothetical protein Q7I99_01005 [Acholeplasmataceae bacterium]|nr:hypothetical protein [Acholeplasmataceae bacterium]
MDNYIINLGKKLNGIHPENKKMVIGFDGFIDEIIHAVDKRQNSNTFTRIETIADLAKRIEKASGLSTNIELYPLQQKIGGNGPIMCNALAKHDASITYIGALGVPNIHDVFYGMPKNVELYSFANSGHTDAIEFNDGKLMLGKMSSLNDVTYENLIRAVGKEKLITLLSETDLFAAVNWSMIPYMTDLWEKILINIVPLLPAKVKKPVFFIDLADPEKREVSEIKKALLLLQKFKTHFYVVLGLNKKEAYDIASMLDLGDENSSLQDINRSIYDYLNLDSIVVHPVDRSSTIINNQYFEAMGPLALKPKLTTGAGDNFNSGFVFGLLLGLDPMEALHMGMATSGYYVRNAISPTYNELKEFMLNWGYGTIE